MNVTLRISNSIPHPRIVRGIELRVSRLKPRFIFQNGILKIVKKICILEVAHAFLINFSYAKCKVKFFILYFLISQLFSWGSTWIKFWHITLTPYRPSLFLVEENHFTRHWHKKRRLSWPVGRWESEEMLGRVVKVEKKVRKC